MSKLHALKTRTTSSTGITHCRASLDLVGPDSGVTMGGRVFRLTSDRMAVTCGSCRNAVLRHHWANLRQMELPL